MYAKEDYWLNREGKVTTSEKDADSLLIRKGMEISPAMAKQHGLTGSETLDQPHPMDNTVTKEEAAAIRYRTQETIRGVDEQFAAQEEASTKAAGKGAKGKTPVENK